MKPYYARGKILLTSEFIILHGAKALAIPLKLGQSLHLKEKKQAGELHWEAGFESGNWLEVTIALEQMEVKNSTDDDKAENLLNMLTKLLSLKPEFKDELSHYDVHTQLEFNPQFGFGSSSTLTSLLAQWAEVDPMQYHFSFSKGSGYDVACANAESAILYELIDEMPVIEALEYYPPFIDQLWLVYLGEKQDTSKSITAFLNNYTPSPEDTGLFSRLSCSIYRAATLQEFGSLIEEHEGRLSEILDLPVIKDKRFSDLNGYAKSLGAWGGDFALIATPWTSSQTQAYFRTKNIQTWFSFKDIII